MKNLALFLFAIDPLIHLAGDEHVCRLQWLALTAFGAFLGGWLWDRRFRADRIANPNRLEGK